ncbi:MAG: M15 family metallopeptidase [Cyanobacteriota/Melainabacteria group bacterium]
MANLPMDKAFVELLENTGVWSPDCPLAVERLVNLKISYCDFAGELRDDGLITVMDVLAESVERIFNELLEMRFPIEQIRSMHHYHGDDELSMGDNNSSSFNSRSIAGTKTFSIHSYGAAIDINPLQNPYLQIDEENGMVKVNPKKGWSYLNRRNRKAGMVEEIIPVFAQHGFVVWGGTWTTPIDYHHFQLPRFMVELLASLEPEEGRSLLAQYMEVCHDLKADLKVEALLGVRAADPDSFRHIFAELICASA